MDEHVTLAEIKGRVRRFRQERGWDSRDTPKDLAIGISTEAAELLEHFQFRTTEECRAALADPEEGPAIAAELADILFFAAGFADQFGIDLSEAMEKKQAALAARHPVDSASASARLWRRRGP